MHTYSIDTESSLAVHPDKDTALKEAGAESTTFTTEAELSEATALWPASRLVGVWNGFAGAPPFAELKEVKRFTDRKSAVTRIWAAAQRLGSALEEEMKVAEQDMLRAQQEMLSATKAAKPAKLARTAATKAPAKPKATKDTTSKDDAPVPKQREGTRKATVIALLERARRHFGRDHGRNGMAKTFSSRLHLDPRQQARLHDHEHAPRDGPGAMLLD